MNKKQPTQEELFKNFIKLYTQSQLCEFCLHTYDTSSYLAKLPGEEFFRYAQLCVKCVNKQNIEVK